MCIYICIYIYIYIYIYFTGSALGQTLEARGAWTSPRRRGPADCFDQSCYYMIIAIIDNSY